MGKPALLLVLMLAALLASAMPASARRFCPPVAEIEEGAWVKIEVGRSHVSCAEARHTIKAFADRLGTLHGAADAPASRKYWTLHGGWRCFVAESGFRPVWCTRDRKSRESIEAFDAEPPE